MSPEAPKPLSYVTPDRPGRRPGWRVVVICVVGVVLGGLVLTLVLSVGLFVKRVSTASSSAPAVQSAPAGGSGGGGEGAAVLVEAEKIERLMAYVGGLEGAVFIRNGAEYPPAAAAEHMRTKWGRARGSVKSAREFVEVAASRSSISGEVYRVRLGDGRVVTSRELLLEELGRMEGVGGEVRTAKPERGSPN